jgi:hypothetical protein
MVTLGFIIICQLTRRNIAGDSNYSPSPPSEIDVSQRIGELEDCFDLVEDFNKHGDLFATCMELWVFFDFFTKKNVSYNQLIGEWGPPSFEV